MKIVLAGAEDRNGAKLLLELGVPNVLCSYHYIRDQKDSGRKLLEQYRDAGIWVMIDSGAFTFKQKYMYLNPEVVDGEGKLRPNTKWGTRYNQAKIDQYRSDMGDQSLADAIVAMRAYNGEYVAWVREMSSDGLFAAFAELDVDLFVGDEIWDWREDWAREVDLDRVELIATPHGQRSIEAYQRCYDSGIRYFGASGIGEEGGLSAWFNERLRWFESTKSKLHGWALTTQEAMLKYPFFSVDSASWLSAQQWGTTFIYRGSGKMENWDENQKYKRHGLADLAEEAGVDIEAFCADKWPAVRRFSCYQWLKLAQFMETYNVNAYWLSPEEVAETLSEEQKRWNTALSIRRAGPQKTDLTAHPAAEFGRFCNTCFLAAKCPRYERDTTCVVGGEASVTDADSLKGFLLRLLEAQGGRVMHAMFVERVGGAPLDPLVSRELRNTFDLAKIMKEVFDTRDTITVQAKGRGAGIIAQMFAGFGTDGENSPSD